MSPTGTTNHHEVIDVRGGPRPRVVMVVANPTTSTTTGWPVGFWAAELFYPLHVFARARYEVTVVSPDVGGVVRARALAKRLDDADLVIIDKCVLSDTFISILFLRWVL